MYNVHYYDIHYVCCTLCMPYIVYAVHYGCERCVVSMLYTMVVSAVYKMYIMYDIHFVCCTLCMLYIVYAV